MVGPGRGRAWGHCYERQSEGGEGDDKRKPKAESKKRKGGGVVYRERGQITQGRRDGYGTRKSEIGRAHV